MKKTAPLFFVLFAVLVSVANWFYLRYFADHVGMLFGYPFALFAPAAVTYFFLTMFVFLAGWASLRNRVHVLWFVLGLFMAEFFGLLFLRFG